MSCTEVMGSLITSLLSWPLVGSVALVIVVSILKGHIGIVLDALSERIRIGGVRVSHTGSITKTEIVLAESISKGEIKEARDSASLEC